MNQYFSNDYIEARKKFLDAAEAADVPVIQFRHPLKGPNGEELGTDIALIGSQSANNMVIVGSATHGIEGFCGSGCQTGFLKENWSAKLNSDTALILVHANNPHGFAHQRRVNEDNIDLNRNFIDFHNALPDSSQYAKLHSSLVPDHWDGPTREEAAVRIETFKRREGLKAFQQNTSSGQYDYPEGLFYGGRRPSWSRNTIENFAKKYLSNSKRIGIIDFHTGLGPRGFGEIIGRGDLTDPQYERASAWYGPGVKSAAIGNSASVRLTGTIDYGYSRSCPNTQLTAITLEFGTLPLENVHLAIRADNWVYVKGGGEKSPYFKTIKEQMRTAFYGEDSQWKQDVWVRAQEVVELTIHGISE